MPLDVVVVCPGCKGALIERVETLQCTHCAETYPIVYGIADLRPKQMRSVYADDPKEIEPLFGAFDRLGYTELENRAFGKADDFQAMYRAAAEQRGEDNWAEAGRLAGETPIAHTRRALDIGCGPGGNLVALARRFDRTYGIDVSFKILLLAKKRLSERGLTEKVTLIAASASALPFPGESFDFVTAMNVIEHVDDQPGMLREINRVLTPSGVLFFDSPNRFSLMPEPHVKLWGVGFLPRRWAEPYVRFRKGIGYEGKRLLSLFELRRLLRHAFEGHVTLGIPSFEERPYYPEGQLKKAVRKIYNGAVRRMPVLRDALFPFVPTFHVLVRKSRSS